MNLLLDTHAFLWAVDDSPRLSQSARAAIVDGSNVVFVSAATAWEIAIKKAIGKLIIPQDSYLNELRIHRFTHCLSRQNMRLLLQSCLSIIKIPLTDF